MPAQFEIRIGAHEQVEELHDQLVVAALQQLGGDGQDRGGEIVCCEDRRAGQRRVQEALDAPDAVGRWGGGRAGGPGGELAGEGADVGPGAGAGEGGGGFGGFAEGGEVAWWEEGWDYHVAVFLEGC